MQGVFIYIKVRVLRNVVWHSGREAEFMGEVVGSSLQESCHVASKRYSILSIPGLVVVEG